MFGRDRGRFADARRRLNQSPLGAAALAGTSFPIDRDSTAAALGFDGPAVNSLDAVSDRDFVIEFLAAAALTSVHLSRLAEELIIWTSAQFNYVRLPDGFTTGSSIMPQKRNADAAELVRGKTGRVIGALNLAGRRQGPAAGLQQGHAGRQGTLVRRRRYLVGLPGRDDWHDQRLDGQRAGHAGLAGGFRPPPTSPTGWCGP